MKLIKDKPMKSPIRPAQFPKKSDQVEDPDSFNGISFGFLKKTSTGDKKLDSSSKNTYLGDDFHITRFCLDAQSGKQLQDRVPATSLDIDRRKHSESLSSHNRVALSPANKN